MYWEIFLFIFVLCGALRRWFSLYMHILNNSTLFLYFLNFVFKSEEKKLT